jgi:hypothetical protein
MKTIYLDLGMGAAGDMLSAALYELLTQEQKNNYLQTMNHLGISGLTVSALPVNQSGINGTHMSVSWNGLEEGCEETKIEEHEHKHEHNHEHEHEHEHEHGFEQTHHHDSIHSHTHTKLAEILQQIEKLPLSEKVKKQSAEIYQQIAYAEAEVHGVSPSQIHFHEVGNADALADIVGVCYLMEMLAPDQVIASDIHVGSGTVSCAHGILPVPAPATAILLKGLPILAGTVQGELCTPTGAALIKTFVTKFEKMPLLRVEKIGYGMGKKKFPVLNALRAFLGESEDSSDKIWELSCNLDDMTPEDIGFAMELLLQAGALDVFTTPIGMKKCRPGILLTALVKEEDRQTIVKLMLLHTTTIGVRQKEVIRSILDRQEHILSTSIGEVKVKKCQGYGIKKSKPEFEDLQKIALEKQLPLSQVRKIIQKEEQE